MKQKNIFNRKFMELSGCVHSHSNYSYDSQVQISQIIQAARQANLDYFTINDHRSRGAAADEALQAEQDIFGIVGCEINDPQNKNHLLVFGSERIITGADAEYYTKEYQQAGATTFAAHPIEKRQSAEFKSYEWTDRENSCFDGLEIWNYMSQWIGTVKRKSNGLFRISFPHLSVRKPHQEVLDYWDSLNKQGLKKAGIGSVDAHEQHYRFWGINLKFLSHKFLFKTIRTNLLIDSQQEISEKNIIAALGRGNSYIVNYHHGNPFNFFAGISDQNSEAIFGEEISLTENLKFYYRLPSICKVKLICDGKIVAQQTDEKGCFPINSAGNYRLEIYKYWRGWIFTNNIYVTK
ncbi:MAG: PHP domain-containing protein [Candidatus Cloacimonadales bacterium]